MKNNFEEILEIHKKRDRGIEGYTREIYKGDIQEGIEGYTRGDRGIYKRGIYKGDIQKEIV